MSAEKLTSAKLAEILQIQPSSISHLLSGRNRPGFEFISKLMLMFPEMNPDWFINGQGDMYRNNRSIVTELPEKVTDLNSTSCEVPYSTQNELFSSITDVNKVSDFDEVSKVSSQDTPDTNLEKHCMATSNEIVDRDKEDKDEAEKIVIFYPNHSFEIFYQRK